MTINEFVEKVNLQMQEKVASSGNAAGHLLFAIEKAMPVQDFEHAHMRLECEMNYRYKPALAVLYFRPTLGHPLYDPNIIPFKFPFFMLGDKRIRSGGRLITVSAKVERQDMDVVGDMDMVEAAKHIFCSVNSTSQYGSLAYQLAEILDMDYALTHRTLTDDDITHCGYVIKSRHGLERLEALGPDGQTTYQPNRMNTVLSRRPFFPPYSKRLQAFLEQEGHAPSEKLAKALILSESDSVRLEGVPEGCNVLGKDIALVEKDDVLLFDGFLYTANAPAHPVKTCAGDDWVIEVNGKEGKEAYLYGSFFKDRMVAFVVPAESDS